jgi:RNA polymerase sigma factor for flagellar operon FliA
MLRVEPRVTEQDLVRQGLPVVVAVCRRLARRLGGVVPLDDLTGIGNLALVDVARAWDPSRAAFVPYARVRLKWAILDGLRRETHARASLRAAALIASDRLADAEAEESEPGAPTTQEEDQAALADLLSAHAAALALGLAVASPDVSVAESPEEEVGRAEVAHVIRTVIDGLPDRERALMQRHYYGGEPFDAIARDLGISKSWASRLHERAVQAVKRALRGPADPGPDGAPASL